jgi:hypothetical protein
MIQFIDPGTAVILVSLVVAWLGLFAFVWIFFSGAAKASQNYDGE